MHIRPMSEEAVEKLKEIEGIQVLEENDNDWLETACET